MTTITLVSMTTEECKDSYVVTCNPSHPPQQLPECENGWEIGNGTAVCATEPPAVTDLATTGNDPSMAIGGLLLAVGMVAIGGALVIANARKKEAQRRADREEQA